MSRNKIEKSNKYGRLYKDTRAFLEQPSIQKQINDLLESDIIRLIEKRKVRN